MPTTLPTEQIMVRLESVLADLKQRTISNRPMNTEELVATLLAIAESVHALMPLVKGE